MQQIFDLGDTGYIHWLSEHWGSENIRQAAKTLIVKAGIADASDNGNRRPSRRGERAGYEPCSDEERQAMWVQHDDWACAFVSAEEERMRKARCPVIHVNTHVFVSAAMKQLGLNKRQAQALAEAHSIETAEPLDVTEFLGDPS